MATVNVQIREARDGDFEWVSNLMQNALELYYGGDHRAHAKRIFDAHIAGGYDRIGFFSFEQHMSIVEVDGVRAGMIHLVGKRQSTYKISPLIVSPEFQGHLGLGSRLLEYAEAYVRSHQARQLYCTVAEQNVAAMQFFLRKGFIRA
ncbi:MAG: GNAT family N-acetyltransferase, partial [Candidatus Omnitrophota bacterium]